MSEDNIKNEAIKVRDDTLDIMKGLCILFVVLGHTYTKYLSDFVYLFHVAVFFMVSGYCFNDKYLKSWNDIKVLLKKRILSLWVPYVCWNFVFLLLQNIFLKMGLTTNNPHYYELNPITSYGFINYLPFSFFPVTILKSFFFMNCRPFVGGLWFLGGLFFVTTAYSIVEIILKKIKLEKFHIVVSLLFLFLGYFTNKLGLFSNFGITKQLVIILETEILFTLGFQIKKLQLLNDKITIKQLLIILVVTTTSLIVLMFYGKISIASNIITNPFYFLAVSILGWFFVWSVSKFISKSFIKFFFLLCGNKTIPILALHTLAFKLITLLQYFMYKVNDIVVLALFPVYKNSVIWALLYVVVGIGIPLLISYVLGKSKILKTLFRF